MTASAPRDVVVVGGGSGIGHGIALAFAAAGDTVSAWGTRARCDLDHPTATKGVAYERIDATDAQAVGIAAHRHTGLDVLVLCQGTVSYARGEFDPATFRHVVDTNLNSMMTCAVAFREALAARRGAIVTISSTSAFRATRGNPAYAASKAGVVGLTRSLAQAWAPIGIRVNGIAPGYVDTKLTRTTMNHGERRARALNAIPVGRFGEPADMAAVALFLASPAASYVVGQTIVVDGGMTL